MYTIDRKTSCHWSGWMSNVFLVQILESLFRRATDSPIIIGGARILQIFRYESLLTISPKRLEICKLLEFFIILKPPFRTDVDERMINCVVIIV